MSSTGTHGGGLVHKQSRSGLGNIHCPQCGGNATLEFAVKDLNEKLDKEDFKYYKCNQCELIFLNPVPVDLGRHYPSSYHSIPKQVEDLRESLDFEEHKLELVEKYSEGKKLLEIGPSFGAFSYLAKSKGYDVHAIEIDPECRKFLKEKIGIRVKDEVNVSTALLSGEKYDVICFWHSIEHLPNPWSVIDSIGKAIEPSGLLMVSTPNPQSLQYKLFGKYWVHVDAPRHVTLIPFSVLQGRLEKNGFQSCYFTSNDRGAKDCNALGWQVSLNHFLRTNKNTRYIRRAGRLLGKFFSRTEWRAGNGSTYTAVFRKIK